MKKLFRLSEDEPPKAKGSGAERCSYDCILMSFRELRLVAENINASNELNKVTAHALVKQPAELTKSQRDHIYLPLRPWQTRIVKLLPAKAGSTLKCELLTVEFVDMEGVGISGTDDVITYEALSYSWGNLKPTHSIICNGLALPLANNLWLALKELRIVDNPRYIWCDTICIDQGNLMEKSQQIKNMLRIFEKATNVIAWLGIRSPENPTVLQRLQQVGEWVNAGDIYSKKHSAECAKGLGFVHGAVRSLCDLSWFKRTWIRQEVFAAKNLLLQSHGFKCSYMDFVTLICNLLSIRVLRKDKCTFKASKESHSGTTAEVIQVFQLPTAFGILYDHFQHRGSDRHDFNPPEHHNRYSVHWLRSLQAGVSFQVTDPRDRVYGAFGIITSPTTRLYVESRPDINPGKFPISYEKSLSEVYQDVVKYLINTDRNLDCLTIIEDRRGRAEDIPSWVPDWRNDVARSFLNLPPDEPDRRDCVGLATQQDFGDKGRLVVDGERFFSPIRSLKVAENFWSASPARRRAKEPGYDIFPHVQPHGRQAS